MCLLRLQRRHSLDLEWKWKSFWTSGACRCIQCGHVFTSWLGWNTVETVGVAPSQSVVPCTVYCNTLISILSLQGFQLPTFHAGWCWLVLIRCNLSLPQGFQLSTFRAGWCCNLLSLSSGVSTANLLWWMVIIRCNLLSPQGFQLPFFRIHGYFSAVR